MCDNISELATEVKEIIKKHEKKRFVLFMIENLAMKEDTTERKMGQVTVVKAMIIHAHKTTAFSNVNPIEVMSFGQEINSEIKAFINNMLNRSRK